ncbi:MAG TPA: hypothetical protein VFX96_00280 [Pyrinomonadaceae bacterium]|nr:hypothetical protein [Pyrinomonadaceae bacterium]
MKKVSLLPLIAAVALSTACPDPASNNAGGGNSVNNNRATTQNDNANTNANTNTDPSLTPFTKEDKTVVIVVYDDATTGRRMILAAPDKLKLVKARNERLDFYVINNLDDVLTSLTVAFTGANGDPMDGVGLSFTNVPAGGAQQGRTGRIKAAAADGSYKYTVSTAPAAGPSPTPLDPEIIINRDR